MSRSAGTGSPVWFRCTKCRSTLVDNHHTFWMVTGRMRPYDPGKYHTLGSRSTLTSREYVCSCGHIGWSNHIDLLARELGRSPTDAERMERKRA